MLEAFRGWLRTIVNRRVADFFPSIRQMTKQRHQSFSRNIETREERDPAELVAEETALKELEARALHLIRESTAERTWQMFWLSTVEQVPTAEIAKQFGVSSAAVRVAKARVLGVFGKCLSTQPVSPNFSQRMQIGISDPWHGGCYVPAISENRGNSFLDTFSAIWKNGKLGVPQPN